MDDRFYSQPILNSPYEPPLRHWELAEDGQPTQRIMEYRRPASFVTPIPKPKRSKTASRAAAEQVAMVLDEGRGLSTSDQQYDLTSTINTIREMVAEWRRAPNPRDWHVSPETERLLAHWRHHEFTNFRPFFCQVEAVETVIWLTEVAPQAGVRAQAALQRLADANGDTDLSRLALKMATGSGKTTVMAMLIAWQTINAVRHPNRRNFTKGFLVVTPGITIRDRLRVLQPNDPDAYYEDRELVPGDMLQDLQQARIVITNFHAFKLRDTLPLPATSRRLLQGRGEELHTEESAGQMLQRVMPELLGLKDIMVLNDEAHHCYRERPPDPAEEALRGEERDEAEENNEAARLWVSGLEMVAEKLGIRRVIDLSATPFFLRGSGYEEGTLFPWTMSDFSLMDAIECGIVKLPRVPVADNIPGGEMPRYRNLWDHIGRKLPRKGAGKAKDLDPLALPVELQTALEALYGHYARTFALWQEAGIEAPPCFIIVCQNTSISKLVYDYVSGFERENEDGSTQYVAGRLELLRNADEYGNAFPEPRTLLIDSHQLESGEALDKDFREMAAEGIERFRQEITQRTGDRRQAENIPDTDLLREVMNTVGKAGRLGASIRCVVSVSMLTEGWDANTVTHILGVRAFGTQLLCEQVVGRALRRISYDLNADGLYEVEYADVLGIPFDFASQPMDATPKKPKKITIVEAVSPDRDAREIQFPRVQGYRIEMPEGRLTAEFNADSCLVLSPDLVGPSITHNSGIIGEGVDLNLEHLRDTRASTLLYHLTKRLITAHWREPGEAEPVHLFGQLKRIARQWLDQCLACVGGTHPALLMYQELADMACERITAAITRAHQDETPVRALLDPYNPVGSTVHVRFLTSKTTLWTTDSRKCHVNYAVCDGDWEAEFCRVVEAHPRTLAYVKNQALGFEVPYELGGSAHHYVPDFIVLLDDGHGAADPLHLVVEIKGFRGEDAKQKKSTIETYWVPGVNRLGQFGRWAFAEMTEVFGIQADFGAAVEAAVAEMIAAAVAAEQER
jgi:type III restriction enzyme